LLCLGVTFAYSARLNSNEGAKSLFDNSGPLYSNEPNLAVKSGDSIGNNELFFKMIFMVLAAVVMGAAAFYLSKKLLPKFTQLGGKRIEVLETVHLGPRKAIHLIKIGKQNLLIGSTNENITKLSDITDPLSEVDLPANPINNN